MQSEPHLTFLRASAHQCVHEAPWEVITTSTVRKDLAHRPDPPISGFLEASPTFNTMRRANIPFKLLGRSNL